MAPIPQKTNKKVRTTPKKITTDDVYDAFGNSVTELLGKQKRRDRKQDNQEEENYSNTIHTNEEQELDDTQQQQGRENLNAMIDLLNPEVTLDSTQVTTILTKLGLENVLSKISTIEGNIDDINEDISNIEDELSDHEDRIYALEHPTT